MAEVLFTKVPDGHIFTLAELRARLDAIGSAPASLHGVEAQQGHRSRVAEARRRRDLMEAFGYRELSMTSRQFGTGLIIEAGLRN